MKDHSSANSVEEPTISLFEVVEFIYHSRAWLLAGLVAGIVAAGVYWVTAPVTQLPGGIEFRVYSSGTPYYSASEILDQLNTRLRERGLNPDVNSSSLSVSVRTDDSEIRSLATMVAAEIADTVDQQSAHGLQIVRSRSGEEGALALRLKYEAYDRGRQSGLINLISTYDLPPGPESGPRIIIALSLCLLGAAVGLAMRIGTITLRLIKRRQEKV